MKYLIICLLSLTVGKGFTQVIFKALSPSSVAGLYNFAHNGTGSSWGLTNLDNPMDAITGELKLAEDGTPGINPQGNPISQEACNTVINDLTGKIAVIYRNTCGFGVKALNAENAGAIGVIIINRDPVIIDMAGGTEGAMVTIPVTMISNFDGALLVNEMNNGPVSVFIGNKQNLFTNDLGSFVSDALLAKSFSTPTIVARTSSEYSFDLGLQVRNFGTVDQYNVSVTARVSFNGSTIFQQSSSNNNVFSGDSAYFDFPPFSLATYAPGRYTLTYQINTTVTDEDPSDNIVETDFMINDSLYSLAPLDPTTNLPLNTGGSRPSTAFSTYSACIHFQNAKADSLQANGLYFSAVTNSADSLSDLEVAVKVLEILDQFTDLNDAPSTGMVSTSEISTAYYTYPQGLQSNMQGEVVFVPFDDAVQLSNDVRYLFCVQANSDIIFINFNEDQNYEMNMNNYSQPLGVIETDGSINLTGFGAKSVPSISVNMSAVVPAIASTYSQQTFSECAGFTVSVGNNFYSTTGTFLDTLVNWNGGDSIVTTYLTILPTASSSQNFTLFPGSSIVVGSNTYTAAGTYTDVFAAQNSCDSTVTTTIELVDFTTTTDGTTIFVGQPGATYQWIDCATNQPIAGAMYQGYTPELNGSYAAIVTLDGVSDTSECFVVTFAKLDELSTSIFYSVLPNPNNGAFTIQSAAEGKYTVVSEVGQVVCEGKLAIGKNALLMDQLSTGVYYIIGTSDKGIARQKMVVIK